MVSAEKILNTAREIKADIIGLSGLITPSLDEMVHVAKEMERQGFKLPLLIGGATTSKIHAAVKIAPNYSSPTVHVLDASRSVSVAGSLLSEDQKGDFEHSIRQEYENLRTTHKNRKDGRKFLRLDQARNRAFKPDWSSTEIVKPSFTGVKVFNDFPIKKIREKIDWTPFFQTWELKGKYPSIFDDSSSGKEAKKLFDDANKLLDEIIAGKLLRANGVIGLFPASSIGDDIELYTNDKRNEVLSVLHTLRQQQQKTTEQPYMALADYIAPKDSGFKDYIGAFAVTSGLGIEKQIERFEKDHDDYNSIMIKAVADRLAEAFAETMHQLVRKEFWGYAKDETLTNDELISENYAGIRPAPGYPAQPDHTEKPIIFDLLKVTENTGIELTESFAMYPASAVSGLYFAHEDSRYFNVGKIDKDQAEDYAKRKNMSLEVIERWLSPILAYEPETLTVTPQ
jgi:5-methyltetrahydrofolate--homocysteine methyltransferase